MLPGLAWMRERVLQIRLALLGDGRQLFPASEYLELCKTWIDEVIDLTAGGARRATKTCSPHQPDSGVTRVGQGLLQCAALSSSI